MANELFCLQTGNSTILKKKLKSCQQSVRRLVRRTNMLKTGFTTNKKLLPATIIKNASLYLNNTSLEFFKAQINLSSTPVKGRRYTNSMRTFALGLYFQSPRAYRYLSRFFILPSTRMLRYYLNRINVEVGWSDANFKLLTDKAKNMDNKDRVCGITFDAISIKSGIYYDISKDKLIGHEDLANYGEGKKAAQQALIFMAKGLCQKWKQALGYFFFLFLSSSKYNKKNYNSLYKQINIVWVTPQICCV